MEAGVNFKMMRQMILILAAAIFLLAPAAEAADGGTVTAAAPGAAFLQGEELRFSLDAGAAENGRWILRNWQDEIIREENFSGTGFTLPALPNGYYKLEVAGIPGCRSFAVVPDPEKREKNPDLFFAVDSAQSWLAAPQKENPFRPADAFAIVSEVARRAGIQMVRERLRWSDVEPEPGKFDWKQYRLNADLLSERGIRISGVYHDAPSWTRSNTPRLPSDLMANYRFARKLAREFRGKMTVWEFWNEPDIGFAPEGAWDYAAALKSAYLGFKAGDPELTVAPGGYARTPLLNYNHVVLLNGAGDYADIFNMHTYAVIRDFPAVLQDIRNHLKRHNLTHLPIWFTENGSNMEGAAREESGIKGVRKHSPAQELLVAEYIAKMMITMQFLGVERDFFFVLPPYNERAGKKDWGMLRHDFTVKPGYAVLATLIDRLGNAEPEGEIRLGDGIKGFLYRRRDGRKILVYWSISELDTKEERPNLDTQNLLSRKFALPGSGGKLAGVDHFGTPFEADGAQMTATRFPAFIDCPPSLRPDIPFISQKTERNEPEKLDRSIVFRTELSDDFKLWVGKDGTDIRNDTVRFKLQAWNFSGREKQGRISVSGGGSRGIPDAVTLPPFGKSEFEVFFKPALNETFKGELRVEGIFGGRATSPLVIPLRNLKAGMEACREVEMPQLVDPVNWRKNSSGEQTAAYDEDENALCFTTEYPAGVDRWTYPEYTLQLPQESLAGARIIAFEAKSSEPKGIRQMLLMLVLKNRKTRQLKVNVPGTEWEECRIQLPPDIDGGEIVKIRLGINSRRDRISYRIRNVRFFYAR